MLKQFAIYLMTNKRDGTLYIGVTSDLARRVFEHKNGVMKGFCKKYNLDKLVYYEFHETSFEAIAREKELKLWKRAWKIKLIEDLNPNWRDLSEDLNK